jgi:hypothetical protein
MSSALGLYALDAGGIRSYRNDLDHAIVLLLPEPIYLDTGVTSDQVKLEPGETISIGEGVNVGG